jgi:hypothetical protein
MQHDILQLAIISLKVHRGPVDDSWWYVGERGRCCLVQDSGRPTAWLAIKQSFDSRPSQQYRDPLFHLELTCDLESALLQGPEFEIGGGRRLISNFRPYDISLAHKPYDRTCKYVPFPG